MQKDRVMKNRKNTVLIESGSIELYGNAKQLRIDGLWAKPSSLPNYSISKSEYPVEESLIPEIEKILLQTNLVIITKSAIDTISNAKDNSAVANISK